MTTDANWLTDYCQAKHTRAMHSLTFPFKILMRSLCPLPFHKSCQNLAPDYTVSKFYWNQLVGQNKCWKMKAKQMGKQTEKVSVWVSFPLGSSLRTMIRQVKEYLISTSLNLAFHYGLKDEEDGRNTLTFSSVMYFSALSTAFWRIRWRNACREKKMFKCLHKVWFHFFISPCFPTTQCAWLSLRLKEYNHIPITTVLRLRAAFKMAETTFPKTQLGFAWQ